MTTDHITYPLVKSMDRFFKDMTISVDPFIKKTDPSKYIIKAMMK
jgi:hypothetical protein